MSVQPSQSVNTSNTSAPQSEPQETTSSSANPAPVGLLCHALTTTVFGVFLLRSSMNGIAAPMAIGFGGILTLMSGMFEYTRGRTLSFTYLVGLGCFWICLGIVNTLVAATTSHALLACFGLWAIVAISLLYPAFYLSKSLGALMLSWVLMCAGCAFFYGTGQGVLWAAVSSFVCAGLGYYKAYAQLAYFAYGREILPLGRKARAISPIPPQESTF